MKRYAKPMTDISPTKEPDVKVPLVTDISIQRLIEDCLTILYREIKNLMSLSVKGKLDAASARDLRDHLKLLFELQIREQAFLNGKSDEELADLLNAQPTTEDNES